MPEILEVESEERCRRTRGAAAAAAELDDQYQGQGPRVYSGL